MLAQLRLRRELRGKEAELADKRAQLEEINRRTEAIERALDEAETEADQQAIDDELDDLPSNEELERLQGEIGDLQEQVDDLNEKITALDEKGDDPAPAADEGGSRKMHNDIVTRDSVKELLRTGEYYTRGAVKAFYDGLKQKRAVTGAELTIPNEVLNKIQIMMGDYGTIYPLCDIVQLHGTARVLIDTSDTSASWLEQGNMPEESDVGTIADVELDGFMLAKVLKIPNYVLKDSIVNLDDYVTKKISKAFAAALDDGVLNGSGPSSKTMTGIIPSLGSDHKFEVYSGETMLGTLIALLGEVDSGNGIDGDITVVMKRSDYYKYIAPKTIQVDSNGRLVGSVPALANPNFFGLDVKFSNKMPEKSFLAGEFNQYIIGERSMAEVTSSDQPLFMKDQTAFKGVGRYDGKPINKNAFVFATIVEEVPTAATDESDQQSS